MQEIIHISTYGDGSRLKRPQSGSKESRDKKQYGGPDGAKDRDLQYGLTSQY